MELTKIRNHIAGWILFILYENLILLSVNQVALPFADYLLHLLLIFIFFYFNTVLVFNTQVLSGSGRLQIALLVAAELFIYFTFIGLAYFIRPFPRWDSNFLSLVITALEKNSWRALYFLWLSGFYWLGVAYVRQKQQVHEMSERKAQVLSEKTEVEKKLQTTQNAFLQSQINPHLLFNTLNFIYNSVEKASHEASEMVMIVNELMRYALREPDHEGKIELAEEIKNIDSFTKLNKLRFANKTFINMIIKGDFRNVRIYPQVLLPLIENIFKHGDLSSDSNPAVVNINYFDGVLYFRSLNRKRKGKSLESSSIGLDNVKNRLNSYYPDLHEFKIHQTTDTFQINLIIRLK